MRKDIDLKAYSATVPPRIKPEKVNLGDLPPIQKPIRDKSHTATVQPHEEGSQTSELPKSVTTEVQNYGTSELQMFRSYELPNFEKLLRFDCRLTKQQKRFLDSLEDDIRYAKPDGEKINPENRRITKASIVRVFVEVFRQLELELEPENYTNEHDLLSDILEKLSDKVTKFRTSEVQ